MKRFLIPFIFILFISLITVGEIRTFHTSVSDIDLILDGKKIFSFKKGLKPAIIPAWYKNGKMFMTDSDGRYYLYDKKGESTKLSNKIKEIQDFNEKYILYKSKSGDFGTMDFNGEVAIRPKYQRLDFGDSGQLIGSRDGKDWEILDYSGNKLKELDCNDAMYIEGFGYLAKDNSGWSVLINKGDLVSKEAEIHQLGKTYSGLGRVSSCYITAEKIVSAVTDLLKPDGVESYTFGQSMVELAQKQGLEQQKLIDDRTSSLDLRVSKISSTKIYIYCFSNEVIAYKATNYNYYSGYHSFPVWNDDSKIGVFKLDINTAAKWGKDGVAKLSDGFKKKGFEMSQSEDNDEYAALLL